MTELKLTALFSTPLLPDDYYYFTRPISYLKLSYTSIDGAEHTVTAKVAVSEEICLDFRGFGKVDTEVMTLDDGIATAKIGKADQKVLARRGDDMNSASSQFFICHQNFASGNGDYAAFGYVVSGMDVVDKIAKVSTGPSDKPKTDVVITSARFANVPAEAMLDPLDLLVVSEEATDYVLLDIENYGKILIHLYADEAPITVANFKELVAAGFYDGLTFHRVIRNFMIQGGDPKGDGTGGSDTTITGEFESNGIVNRIPHIRGTVSMARLKDDMDSATSQFFICHQKFSEGDGDYAAFGYVLEGMDVVDAIANVSVDAYDKPRTTIRITSAKFVIVEEDAYDDPIAELLTPPLTPDNE